jgi:hypothetical protein
MGPYGTGKKSYLELVEIIRKNWGLLPCVITTTVALEMTVLDVSGCCRY